MKNTIIKFHDAELNGVEADGEIFIAIRPICDAIGIDGDKQLIAVKSDEILSELHTLRYVVASDGSTREMLCLPLDFIPGWLFSIETSRVNEAARPTLLLFKRECYKALRDYFFGNMKERVARAEKICKLYETKTTLREQADAYRRDERRIDNEIRTLQRSYEYVHSLGGQSLEELEEMGIAVNGAE